MLSPSRGEVQARPRGGRAAPMAPQERRRAIVDAVIPLLAVHGRAVTTRQVAEAAGIAEGTIFRVFDGKDELIDAALVSAFDPAPFLSRLQAVPRDCPLRDRLVATVTVMQDRYVAIFSLMHAVGLVAPPEHLHEDKRVNDWRTAMVDLLTGLIEPDAGLLRVSPYEFVHVLRLLTFSGSHAHISDGRLMTPEEIVDVVLHGFLASGTSATATGR
jgi:AcrR family transcriptional regulator